MYRVDANSRWRIHCSGPDFTRIIIYAVSKFHGVIRIPGAVYEGYARAGRPVGLPESVVTSGKFQNGVYRKGTGKLFSGFLRCVECITRFRPSGPAAQGARVDYNL